MIVVRIIRLGLQNQAGKNSDQIVIAYILLFSAVLSGMNRILSALS